MTVPGIHRPPTLPHATLPTRFKLLLGSVTPLGGLWWLTFEVAACADRAKPDESASAPRVTTTPARHLRRALAGLVFEPVAFAFEKPIAFSLSLPWLLASMLAY